MTESDILGSYIDCVKNLGYYPSLDEFKNSTGITREQIRTRFTNLEGLRLKAINSGKLKGIILDISALDTNYVKESIRKLSKYRRFVITTAVTNSKVNKEYYESIKTYCKIEKAGLIVIPAMLKGKSKWTLDPVLENERIVFHNLRLNSNIQILGIMNNAKSVDPITGLPRLGKRNGSVIVGSPKQNLKLVPTGISKLPHALMSTGAITRPDYPSNNVMSVKQDVLASNDHVTGCLIVELDENDMFHYRQTQADTDNGFTDLGYYYRNGKKSKYSPEALVGGDIHVTETCPISEKAMFEIINVTNTKYLISHDIFTARSCNHHEQEKRLFLANRASKNELSIDLEISELAKWLKNASKKVKEIIVVRSNHDEFLDRYLESGSYVNHPYNHRVALNLALYVLDGLNPLEQACKQLGVSNKVKWLKRDESYRLAGIELGAHGDKGANGSRGSAKSLEEGYGACVYGHSHTPGIVRSAFCVGTNTVTKPYYGSGPNSWLNTDCLVYNNGVRQLINKIEGSWTTRKF